MHLDRPHITVRVIFFDFSSTLDTVQPVCQGCLSLSDADGPGPGGKTTDYFTDRPQYVKVQGCLSGVVTSSTGTFQETILSPFLFTIYTSDFCFNCGTCHLQKFSDDSFI